MQRNLRLRSVSNLFFRRLGRNLQINTDKYPEKITPVQDQKTPLLCTPKNPEPSGSLEIPQLSGISPKNTN